MIILGIDTATTQVACALGGQEGVLANFEANRGLRHVETLVPAIDFLCQRAEIDKEEIKVIAVDAGPGLFTGMRVGIAAGKAMAYALNIPMIGLSSLDLLAFPVRWTNRLIVTVIDARRGEIFYAYYRQVSGGVQREGELCVGKPEDLAADLMAEREEVLLVGDGAHRYAEHFKDVHGVEFASQGQAYPSAASLVELAQAKALREEFVTPDKLEPIYLRKSDAEINRDKAEAAAAAGK